MKNLIFTLLVCLCGLSLAAQKASLSGTISDAANGEALIGATIVVMNTNIGTSTDATGKFMLENLDPGAVIIQVSFLGYTSETREVELKSGENTLDLTLQAGITLGEEIVVSGSKKPEKLTESPATIETIFAREIEEYPGNPGELIARQKGIDYFRAGIATPAFNIRGFNSNFNSKNLQVTDGRFSTLIATGLPLGPLNTTIKEDIERLEVILGPNSTLYGPNAHNGLLNTITKDPRTSEGTTIVVNPGVSGDGDLFYSLRARHAQKVNNKFAYKVMAEYTAGSEFDWVDSVYIDRINESTGELEPDGITEGYEELELNEDVSFLRAEAALYYSPNKTTDIIFNTGYSNSNYLSPTNVGRNQIIDWRINYYQLRLNTKNFFAQVYYTTSKTDDTYSIDERTKQYYRLLDSGFSDEDARGEASYASAARFVDDSRRLNAEVQYNNSFGGLELITGVQYQLDQADSKGSYLLDDDGSIDINQVGGYAHLNYNFGAGFKAIAALRADYHEIYDLNFVPKFGLVSTSDIGTFRLTYGQGIAAPTIINMFGDLFNGLILGNAEGFTLADGTMIENQKVERLQTFELGYRGQVVKNKLFLDANAYYNISRDFLSPVTVIGVATERGDTPMSEVQSGFAGLGGLVATYVNFGEVFTYGLDIGMTYYFRPDLSATVNYSYFDFDVDENNMENDFNNDGVVNFLDILVNAPTNKASLGINYNGSKIYGSLFGRWVQEYNYFSSFQIASETQVDDEGRPIIYRGVPIVENARGRDAFNYGPLGGFVTIDASIGYRFNEKYSVAVAASNLLNEDIREFTASPPTRGLYTFELMIKL
ncbi:MAG: TonB-dependent receptor [Saprospiraceae bacterium]|nr:TonB-dependent receptor [Saprospiraceae bacterium]